MCSARNGTWCSLIAWACLAIGCHRRAAAGRSADAGKALDAASAGPRTRTSTHSPRTSTSATPTAPGTHPASADWAEDGGLSELQLDKPVSLGTAKAVVAIGNGILFRTKVDELPFRPYERPKREVDAAPLDEETLSVLPAPAIARGSRAYWISKGRLLRREFRQDLADLAMGPLEELASDAYDATRVAVWTADTTPPRDIVAYVARPPLPRGDRRARLWIESGANENGVRGRTYELSEDAAGASSVALIGDPDRVWAVSLDARAVLCPLHARPVELWDSGPPQMGADVVIFVGEPQASHTEISSALWGKEPFAMVPLPKYGGGFGLVVVPFGWEPRLDSPGYWTMYPAGLDRALTTTFEACGQSWVAYVRPQDDAQGASRVLVAAPLSSKGLGRETVVGDAHGFLSLSFAGVSTQPAARRARVGWLAWSADGTAWARAVRCP